MPDTYERPAEVARLEALFRTHPAWREAARHIRDDASSDVHFSSQEGKVWHLVRVEGETLLLDGPSPDPDFAFGFNPAAVDRLAAVEGGVGAFAVELFQLITETDPAKRIGFRIATSFPQLVRKGYLTLLASGGLRVLAFGASRGIRTLSDLRTLVEQVRSPVPEAWETRTDDTDTAKKASRSQPGP
jgi:hypothetical protein